MIPFQRTRLAPSPTGALHLGHARTFLLAWWMARQAGAKIFMRMEDLDEGRARPESIEQAYADLRWLGMAWDEWDGAGSGTGNSEWVQSKRLAHYAEALGELWEREAIYPCTCSRSDIAVSVARSASAPHEGDVDTPYPGTCAGLRKRDYEMRNVAEVEEAVRATTGKKVCWRLRVLEGVIAFNDVIAGRRAFDVARTMGDFPVTRFDGAYPRPAYQLACVVDDHAMGIDLVVRGDDLLSSTPRQMLVYRALGWEIPRFAHVPLVVGADGKRLAKRHGESRIAQFRQQGVTAERIVGWAAWRSGQLEQPREITAREMVERFEVLRIPTERVVLGADDAAWLTGSAGHRCNGA